MTRNWAQVLHGFEGEMIEPCHPDYDESRKVFNALIDRQPEVIARCKGEGDIIRAVQAARMLRLPLAVRGGGHSVAGYGVCDRGIVVDLSEMRRVTVPADSNEVLAEGGARWWDVDHASSRAGLAVPGGIISSTGIGGFTLGGGLGWLSRMYGLSCDNLIAARLVTAAGAVMTVSQEQDPELFWAIRGGGGNFGIVSQFHFQAHRVSRVNVLICVYPQECASEVLSGFCEVMDSAPDEVAAMLDFSTAGDTVGIPTAMRGRPVISLLACCTAVGEQGAAAIAPLTRFARPLARLQKEMRYNTWQQLLDQTAPAGRYNYWKSEFLSAMTEKSRDAMVGIGAERISPESHVHVIRAGGAPSRVPADATAFAARRAPYLVHLISTWTDSQDSDRCIGLTKLNHSRIEPFSAGPVYLNFVGDEGDTRIQRSYGAETFAKLRRIKTRLDPENLFSLNQNIPPLACTSPKNTFAN